MGIMESGSASPRVLVVDDDPDVLASLERGLRLSGFEVATAVDGAEALRSATETRPDAIVLDINMPVLDGVSVVTALRAMDNDVPVCVLSARSSVDDRVAGLEAGADDYVTKPVNVKELAARIRAALRRLVREVSGRAPDVTRFGDVELRRSAGIVMKAGVEVALTKTELRLLIEFADHPEMVLSRDQLLERVWGYEYLGDSRLVDAHIRRLRVKIEDTPNDPRFITTARGLGYRFHPGS